MPSGFQESAKSALRGRMIVAQQFTAGMAKSERKSVKGTAETVEIC
jgi:hypothetical protein